MRGATECMANLLSQGFLPMKRAFQSRVKMIDGAETFSACVTQSPIAINPDNIRSWARPLGRAANLPACRPTGADMGPRKWVGCDKLWSLYSPDP